MMETGIELKPLSIEEIQKLDKNTPVGFRSKKGFFTGKFEKLSKGLFTGINYAVILYVNSKDRLVSERLDIGKKGNEILSIQA